MPHRRTATVITIGAVLAVAALGAGGWAVVNSMGNSFHIAAAAPSKTPTAAPTPVDEEEAAKLAAEKAAKGLAIGAVLTAEQAKAISHYWQGQLLPYEMADGSQVLIARDQPLPEGVKAGAGKKLTAAAQASAAQQDSINNEVGKAEKTVAFQLGRKIYAITYLQTYVGSGDYLGWTWMNGTDGVQYDSAEAAIAALGPIPAGTEVIISD